MKLLILVGSGAVGKMTVGQSIMRKTALRLFHNHMMIEPVIEIFGEYNHSVVAKLRRTIFEEFLKTEREGLIFTYMWAFDCPEDGDYIRSVAELFRSQGAEMYERGLNFLPIDLYESDAVKFKVEVDGIRPPLNSIPGLGTVAAQGIQEARQEGEFMSIDDMKIRAKVGKSTIEMLEKIIPGIKKDDEELLKRIISILFGEKIGEEKTKELIEKIDGGDGKMLAVVDMIRNENKMYINMGRTEGKKEGRKEGFKEGKKQTYLEIAKNLLKLKMPISQISEITKLPKEEIEKLK